MNQRGFVIPSFLLSPTGVMAATIILLSVSNVLFFKLWRDEIHEYVQYKADVSAQQQILKDQTDRARSESERVATETAAGWSAAMDYLRRHPVTVRVPTDCNSSGLRPIPGTTGQFTQPRIEEPGPRTEIDIAECESRINAAVEDAAWIEHVKAWVKQQHEIQR